MRQKVLVAIAVLVSVFLAGNAVSEPIFRLDTPQEGATVFGLVTVSGYVLDDGASCGPVWAWQDCDWGPTLVDRIDLYVDSAFVASADLYQPRYDVLQAYPWYTGTPFERPGFVTSFDSTLLNDGSHTISVRVIFTDGTEGDFEDVDVTVDNNLNQAPFGELELPGESQPMSGVFPVTGWALDDSAVQFVEILVDGLSVGNAVTGIHRPDIGQMYPSHPDAANAGFVKMLNTTHWANGIHVLSVRLVDDSGSSRVIGTRYVQTSNVSYNLPPFGAIDWPISDHVMYAKGCQDPAGFSYPPFEDPQVTELVSGWALDVGSQEDNGGVGYVQLLIDGVVIEDTAFPGFWHPWIDTYVNYYGLPRMDVLEFYNGVPNAKDCGFLFAVDMTYLYHHYNYRPGLHYLKIRAGDLENNVADIAQIPVIFQCDDDPDRPAWGDIYTPAAPLEVVTGVTEITGWSIDLDFLEEIEIWIDGVFIDFADELYLPSPEVTEAFPWFPAYFTDNCGFSYSLDTAAEDLADGDHVLVIWGQDRWGGRNIIGERQFLIDNPQAHEGGVSQLMVD
ncbi:MAG: hypothetical protein V2I67_14155 [Thermoanaerobaculales bacterium]|jgi:hypothetical protein|nr:hypothetical protein [Thermoanaerobaculales bacterium]